MSVKKNEARYGPVGFAPSDQQAATINVFAYCSVATRSFHIIWITFFCCIFSWFCTTNIFIAISDHFELTLTEQRLAASLTVTSTIIFYIFIAYLCPKYGSRITYIVVLLCTMITLIALSLVQSSVGYIICHVFLGIAGTSFVVSQYHITRLFARKIVGGVQAITAGFGHFGGGTANFIAPLIVYYGGISWRWFLIFVSIILFLLCFLYYFGSKDTAKPDPNLSHSLINLNNSRGFKYAFYDYRAWLLFACYAASCGVEFTFYLVGAHYFMLQFDLNEIISGLIIMCWSAINLIATPYGAYLCDKYVIRKRGEIIFYMLFLESIFIILFGVIGHLSLYASIINDMFKDIFVNCTLICSK